MSHYLADLVAPLDALLLKGDADPSTRAIMSSALMLDAVPDAAALEEAFERLRTPCRACANGSRRPAGPGLVRPGCLTTPSTSAVTSVGSERPATGP